MSVNPEVARKGQSGVPPFGDKAYRDAIRAGAKEAQQATEVALPPSEPTKATPQANSVPTA